MSRQRAGMTLVELLVCIAIVVILTALILPAVQKVRGAAQKMSCAHNIKQLALAAHHFDTDLGRLPPAYLGPSLKTTANLLAQLYEGQWIGHLPMLLPYLEQDSIYRQIRVNFNTGDTTNPWFWLPTAQIPDDANYSAAFIKLRIFRCPSASNFTPEPGSTPGTGGTMLGLHVFNTVTLPPFTYGWKDDYIKAARYFPLGRTNYMGVAACGSGTNPFFSKYEGIYTNRSRNSLTQVANQDGTSNTLMYGEVCGGQWNSPPESLDICWMAAGSLGTYLGLQRGRAASTIAFSSYHPGGVQFCFADGSVRTLRFGDTTTQQSSDWLLLQQLGGRMDGGPSDMSVLVE